MLPVMTPPEPEGTPGAAPLVQPDLAKEIVKLDDDAVTATVSALQDLMKQLEGVRARLDAKATTLFSAAGVSLTISGTLTTNAILNSNIVATACILPLSLILCLALIMLVICAGNTVRALLVGPGNPTVDRDALFLARGKTRSWREDIALHYHSTVEAMEEGIAARAPLVEAAQKHFLTFLVSLVILIFSAIGSKLFGTEVAWVGLVLTLIATIAVHTLTNPVSAKRPVKKAPPMRIALNAPRPRKRAPAEDTSTALIDQQAEEEAAASEVDQRGETRKDLRRPAKDHGGH